MTTITLTLEEFETILGGLYAPTIPMRQMVSQSRDLNLITAAHTAGREVLAAVEVMQAAFARAVAS